MQPTQPPSPIPTFTPHLFIQGENSRPSQMTMFALTGGTKRLKIPLHEDIETLSLAEQHALVKEIIEQHFISSGGIAPFFGRIVCYLYRPAPVRCTKFSPAGAVIEEVPNFVEPGTSVTLGGKKVPPGMLIPSKS